MSIVDRVRQLDLPLEEVIVIGSGLLDVLNLRAAGDIDLLVTEALFQSLKLDDSYTYGVRSGSKYLLQNDVEIWTDWGDALPDYSAAISQCVIIQGVAFLDPQALIREKQRMGREKDYRDIRLLEDFMQANPEKF